MMWRIMNFLMLSCKRSSELIEKKLHFGLTFKEDIQLKIHTSMCSACSAYQKQSTDLHLSLKTFIKEHPEVGEYHDHETGDLKERISKRLKEQQ